MAKKLSTSVALALRALRRPKLFVHAIRERGIRYILRTYAESDSERLRRIVKDLEYRTMPPSAESIAATCGEYINSIKSFDESHYIVELKSGERFLLRRQCCMVDMFAILETFVYQEYGTQLDFKDKTVIDIGANVGDTSVYFARQGARVVAYEPSKELFALAVRNIELNSVSVECNNLGVGNCRERLRLTRSAAGADGMSSTIFPGMATNDFLGATHDCTEEIDVVPLADIVARFDSIFLVKMDCQGCEYPALLSLGDPELRKIQHIIIEYHEDPSSLLQKLKDGDFTLDVFDQRGPKVGYVFASRSPV